jgi:predicted dehydrogenase
VFVWATIGFADIRITRKHSLVDDYIDILLYYANFRVRIKAGFFVRRSQSSLCHSRKKGSFKSSWRCSGGRIKIRKKPNLDTWEPNPLPNKDCYTEINGEIVKTSLKGNYYDFDGVFNSITNDIEEPVTATDGILVMKIIEAAIESSAQKKSSFALNIPFILCGLINSCKII